MQQFVHLPETFEPAALRLRVRRAALACAVALVVLALPAAAGAGAQGAQAPPAPETDPFNRDTPRGTITGFNLAVHREDFVSAARYMQVTAAQRGSTERLARDLAGLIDQHYLEPIAALSDAPEGTPDDGLPLDRERVVLAIGEEPAEIQLVRVKDAQGGLVWLISSQTLAQVPALTRAAGATWLENVMPKTLVDSRLLGFSLAQWSAWGASLVIPFAALWVLAAGGSALAQRTPGGQARRTAAWHARLRWPAILVIGLVAHLVFVPQLGFSLRFRVIYSRTVLAAVVVGAGWLLWRSMGLSFAQARLVAQRRGQSGLRSLMLLAERVSKALVVLIAIFALLTIAGVDTTTALAGVGLGGVALALGAQKSVENLLGGVLLLTDRALAVGDVCSIANRVGVVEDITMRSVRLRTIERTLLSVPAGVLSQSNLENFATRDKIPVQTMLQLAYGTTADQLRGVLDGVRALLDGHPQVEQESARIRLANFSARAIELELFAYVTTTDWLRFLAVREELLLAIAGVVEACGTGFAQPTIVYGELPGKSGAGGAPGGGATPGANAGGERAAPAG